MFLTYIQEIQGDIHVQYLVLSDKIGRVTFKNSLS